MTKSTSVVAAAQNAFSPLTSDEVNDFDKVKSKQPSNGQTKFIQPITNDAPELSLKHYKNGEPTQHWAYTDENGNALFYVCRKDLPNGKKVIWPISLVENKHGKLAWQSKWPTSNRPLMNLADILASDTVIITEGESTCDAAQALFTQMASTTFSGGSNLTDKSNYASLNNKRVILSPDNDEAGLKAMNRVAMLAYEAGATEVLMLFPSVFGDNLPKGWDLADALKAGWTPEQCAALLETSLQVVEDKSGWQPENNAFPYYTDKDGVWYEHTTKNGDGYVMQVCTPLEVKALTRDHDNGKWGYVLEVSDRDNTKHQVLIDACQFISNSKEALQQLVDKGLVIKNIPNAEKHVMAFIQECPTDKRGRIAERIGWHGNQFITPEKVYGGQDDELAFFESNQCNKADFKTAGILTEWQDNIAKYAIGNSLYIHAICAAMAAPMLKLLNAENTGFHFRGPSSIGKSTILNVACTIYGLKKLVWRATDNALEAVFANHNNVLLCMDELGQIDQKAAKHIAYLIGNGMGKSRMSQNAMAKKVYEWLLILLSSGEESLQDRMNEGGNGRKQTAGEGIRFVDILAKEIEGTFKNTHGFATGKELSEHLNKASATYHGTAGDAWLEFLTANMDEITQKAYELIKQFEESLDIEDADGQVKRVAVRFANVAAAGEIAIEAGILPWPKGEAIEGVKECFQSWLNERGSKQSSEILNATDNLKTSIGKYETRNFELWDFAMHQEYTTGNKHDVWGWKKQNAQEDWEFYVTENGFKALTGGFHSRELKEALVNEGLMTLADNGEFKKQYRVPNHGRQRLYHLTPYNQG
jgi:putative DNA primase/helicase